MLLKLRITFIVLIYLRAGEPCQQYVQECTNCKASSSCSSYRDMMTSVTKQECKTMLGPIGMVEYDTSQGTCKLFNDCQKREEAEGYSTFMKSSRSDCLQYTIDTQVQHSANCSSSSRYATGNKESCLQFCLHHDDCMGSAYTLDSGTNICTEHSCNSSVPASSTNRTFIAIKCSTVLDCGDPPAPEDGSVILVSANDTTVGATAKQSCKKGYYLAGSDTLECRSSGSWSCITACEVIDCGNPSEPDHGNVTLSDPGITTYAATATYYCDEGYKRDGNASTECTDSGFWSSITVCEIVDCGNPPSPVNGTVIPTLANETTYGATAIQSCDDGFYQNGNNTIQCQVSGMWTTTTAICSPKDCGSLPSQSNGSIALEVANKTTYGATAIQTCEKGFKLVGNGTLYCQSSGTWSNTEGCSILDCGSPSEPDHGNVTLSDPGITTYDATATYYCDEGYKLVGNISTECTDSGLWSSITVCEIVDCGKLPSLSNGSIALEVANKTTYGATAIQTCEKGFKLVGNGTLYCQSSGTWSNTEGCSILDCGDPPKPSKGTVKLAVPGVTVYGAIALQSCDTGYELSGDENIYCQADGAWSQPVTCSLKAYVIALSTLTGVLGVSMITAALYALACRKKHIEPSMLG